MEPNTISVISTPSVSPTVCPVCHQPILPQYYFCPNCGTKIQSAALSTSVKTQIWLYAFSIILPMIAFLYVTHWPGMKYFKSTDEKTKSIGTIAWFLLILSTIFVIFVVVLWTQSYIKTTVNDLNSDLSGFGS